MQNPVQQIFFFQASEIKPVIIAFSCDILTWWSVLDSKKNLEPYSTPLRKKYMCVYLHVHYWDFGKLLILSLNQCVCMIFGVFFFLRKYDIWSYQSKYMTKSYVALGRPAKTRMKTLTENEINSSVYSLTAVAS